MSLPTNYADEWWLEKDSPTTILEEVRVEDSGEIIGYQEVHQFTLVTVRNVFKVTTFANERGKTKSVFNLRTGPDSEIMVAYTGKRFYCSEHTRTLSNPENGLYEERQVWTHRSIGELITAADFAG